MCFTASAVEGLYFVIVESEYGSFDSLRLLSMTSSLQRTALPEMTFFRTERRLRFCLVKTQILRPTQNDCFYCGDPCIPATENFCDEQPESHQAAIPVQKRKPCFRLTQHRMCREHPCGE